MISTSGTWATRKTKWVYGLVLVQYTIFRKCTEILDLNSFWYGDAKHCMWIEARFCLLLDETDEI